MRCSSICVVASGRPTSRRFTGPEHRRQLVTHTPTIALTLSRRSSPASRRSASGPRHRERAPELVRERDRDDPLLDRHRHRRGSRSERAGRPHALLPAPGARTPSSGQHEAVARPFVLRRFDRAAPLQPGQRPLERRAARAGSRAVVTRPSSSAATSVGHFDQVAPSATRAATRCTRAIASAARSCLRRERRASAATSPTSSPTAEHDDHRLDVVGALDAHRHVRAGQEEVERRWSP